MRSLVYQSIFAMYFFSTCLYLFFFFFFFFQAEDGIRDADVTGVQRVLFRSYSPSTTTMSSSRRRSPKAICSPAIKLPKVDWAARPATTPNTPAEASRLVPSPRTAGNV